MKQRAISIKQRKQTFPFDIVEIKFGSDTVKLIRDDIPVDQQVKDYIERSYKHNSRVISVAQFVERHKCEYSECAICYTSNLAGLMLERELYNTPWDDKPRLVRFCSVACEEAYVDEGDFSYRECPICNREICVRNPANGYMYQFRTIDEDNMEMCLSCFQDHYLISGLSVEEIKSGGVKGIFFDHDELRKSGYKKVESNIRVDGSNLANLQSKALELIESGHQVLFDYGSLSIMGDEGYVNIWARPLDKKA